MLKMQIRMLSAAKALTALWLCSLIGAGLAFFTQVILAKQLGADEYGQFASALALVTLLTPLAGFGVAPFWLKVYGIEGWKAKRWINASLSFTGVSSLAVLAVIVLIALAVQHQSNHKIILLSISLFALGQAAAEMVSSKYQLEERYLFLSIWQMAPHLIRFTLIFLLSYIIPQEISATLAAICYSITALLILSASVKPLKSLKEGNIQLKGHTYNGPTKPEKSVTLKVLAQNSWPYGIGAFAHLVYFQSNLILVKYLEGDNAAGQYSVALTIITATYLIPTVFYQKFLLPKIHRWSVHDKLKFRSNYKKGNLIMGIFGVTAMTGIWLLGSTAINIFFGEEYKNATRILYILAATIPLFSLALNAGATLSTQNFIAFKVKYMITVAIISVVISIAAIHYWGTVGAAAATLVCNGILLTLYIYGAEKKVFRNLKAV
ncbi:MAG: polysaccharide biosynthesis protein [Sphingopyxis sp.]|nr:MAG: polysaccharide biosynthesis protein [Sphingopyxis sp.]